MDFSTITPEDIIGPAPVRESDWTVRANHEKKQNWHFHVRAHGVHACVTGVPGDSDVEAEGNALDEFFVRCFPEDCLDQVFGNRHRTYCATPGCHGCDLEVHVARLQDVRLTTPGPAAPNVLVFDLS